MTTDEALTEQIARAYAELTPEQWEAVHPGLKRRAIRDASVVLPIIRKAQAEAWDKGHRDTLAYIASGNLNGDEHHATPTNPHRTEGDQS